MIYEFINRVEVHEAVGDKVKRSMKVDIYFNFIGKYENDLDFKVKCNGQHKGFSSVVSIVRDDGVLEGLDEAVNS